MKIVLSPSKTKTIPDTAIAVRDGQFSRRGSTWQGLKTKGR